MSFTMLDYTPVYRKIPALPIFLEILLYYSEIGNQLGRF